MFTLWVEFVWLGVNAGQELWCGLNNFSLIRLLREVVSLVCEVNSGADMNVLKHYLTPAGSPAVHICGGPLNSAEVRSRSVSTWRKISRLCSMTARGFVVYTLELCSHATFPYSFWTVWVKPLQTQTSSSAKLPCIILALTGDNRPLGVNPTYIWKCLVLISIPFIGLCSNCRFFAFRWAYICFRFPVHWDSLPDDS